MEPSFLALMSKRSQNKTMSKLDYSTLILLVTHVSSILPIYERKTYITSSSESVPSWFKARICLAHFHLIKAKVCQNILDLKYDGTLSP